MPNATLDKLETWGGAFNAFLNAPASSGALGRLEVWQRLMSDYLGNVQPLPPVVVPPVPVQVRALPRHRFGVHLIANREGDLTYIERLRPAAVKMVDPDPNVIRRVLAALDPNGVCILRDWALSEQKKDMAADPVGTGKRHAADWTNKLTAGRFREYGQNKKIVVCGINEPDVGTEAQERIAYEYTKAFLLGLSSSGLRGLALNLSVGWPRNLGPNLPPSWESFRGLEDIINRGNHFLCTHEYWYPQLSDKWGWYGNRIAACPMTVPIIIGECAYTRQLADLPQPWGWIGNKAAPAYAAELWEYHDKVDPNVFAILPFTSGFAGQEWASKDILPIAADILGRMHSYSWPVVWPVPKTNQPPVAVEPPVIVAPPVVVPPEETEVKNIIFPIFTGKITGYYGSVYTNSVGKPYAHEGLDLSKLVGTPIYAPADGIVAFADVDPLYGNYIRTYHPTLKVCFFFAHLSERKVVTGNSIKQGQLIGLTGNTGNSTGPHLHFSVRQMDANGHYMPNISVQANSTLDPLAWLAGWLAAGNSVQEM